MRSISNYSILVIAFRGSPSLLQVLHLRRRLQGRARARARRAARAGALAHEARGRRARAKPSAANVPDRVGGKHLRNVAAGKPLRLQYRCTQSQNVIKSTSKTHLANVCQGGIRWRFDWLAAEDGTSGVKKRLIPSLMSTI